MNALKKFTKYFQSSRFHTIKCFKIAELLKLLNKKRYMNEQIAIKKLIF